MAKEDIGGLAGALDITKTPIYGASEDQLQSLKDAQTQALEALEKRYEKPNWFKVAAGFAKPQLGGFMASLGSASEALGENIEQQRAQQLPISQMRAQLAQTNVIMNQNKTASDMLTERRAKNLPITPEFVAEVVARAPDSSVAKSLQAELNTQQKQQEITSGLQRNALTAMAEARQQGLDIHPEIYKQAGLTPPGGQVAPPQEVPSPDTANPPFKPQTLPNGARVNEEQMKLAELGVPIISGMRSKEDQQKLYDERASNKNPVAVPGTSKHETGNAIDVDTAKLTDEGRGVLKAMGYRQPDPKGDPNHWEKVGAKAQAQQGSQEGPQVLKTGDYHFSPLYTQAQVAETRNQSAQDLNKIANARYASLEGVANPRTYNEMQHSIDAMISTITKNPETVAKVSNMLAQQGGGLMGGVLNAAEAGIGFSVSGLAGNIHLPVNKFLIGRLDADKERPVFEALNTQAARIAKMQQQMNNVNPGTIRNGEIDLYNNASIDPYTQGPNTMLYFLQYTKMNNEMLHEMYTKATKIMQNQDPNYRLNPNSRTQLMDVLTSPAMEDISRKYETKFKKLDGMFQDQLKGK
jgi:hypothetical protein